MPEETEQPEIRAATAGEGQSEPATKEAAQQSSNPTKSVNDAWIGGAVWLVVISIAAFYWFFGGRADVLLNVSGTDPIVATGTVIDDGAPVSAGTVQVRVEDPRGERLLASAVTDVSKTGTFQLEFKNAQLAGTRTNGLRVTGRYTGRTAGPDGEAREGTATVYVNMTPPWSMGWGFIGVMVTMLALVVLFTGPLPPTKARLLFGVTYVVTFSACVIPIVLTVAASGSPTLLEVMQQAPVGIIKAKASGLEEPQWLVNIGGSVTIVPS